jgi:hypothetical protein
MIALYNRDTPNFTGEVHAAAVSHIKFLNDCTLVTGSVDGAVLQVQSVVGHCVCFILTFLLGCSGDWLELAKRHTGCMIRQSQSASARHSTASDLCVVLACVTLTLSTQML